MTLDRVLKFPSSDFSLFVSDTDSLSSLGFTVFCFNVLSFSSPFKVTLGVFQNPCCSLRTCVISAVVISRRVCALLRLVRFVLSPLLCFLLEVCALAVVISGRSVLSTVRSVEICAFRVVLSAEICACSLSSREIIAHCCYLLEDL